MSSLQFFRDDIYDKSAFKQAELAARHLIEPVAKSMRDAGWSEVIGSSGTARALADLLEANAFSERGITADGLDRLRAALIKAGRGSALRLEGLKSDRVPVLAGGLAIMSAVFAELRIEQMAVSDGALRTGVLYELLGRAGHEEDMRAITVREVAKRYAVDPTHAEQVGALAVSLWKSLTDSSTDSLKGRTAPSEDEYAAQERQLRWAASLHEIGLSIAHNGYHKHSAYMLSNADLPGFSKREQQALAAIVLGHTGKLPKMRDLIEAEDDWRLVLCLRTAATLLRSRNYRSVPPVGLRESKKDFVLRVPLEWLEANPLTDFDLRTDLSEWRRIGKPVELELA
jgi:exopolyphosphatase / guanosine-5'-triphosphate,3'-diphosphate pyrophosphatase